MKKKTAAATATAVVVLAAAGGLVAHEVADKQVVLTADGQTSTVHTRGSTVADVLADRGITVGEHDTVVPSPTSALRDGTRIDVGYGRPLTVTLNGRRSVVWTTATDLDEALDQIGISDAARLSVSRSTKLGREGLAVAATTPKKVTLTVGGKATPVTSTAATVAELLTEQKLVPGPKDVLKPAAATPVTDGLAVTLDRVVVTTQTVSTPVPHTTQTTNDASLPAGTRKVTTAGVDGRTDQVVETTTVNGRQTGRTVVSSVTTQPVAEQVLVGTKPAAAPAAPATTAAPATAKPAASSSARPAAATKGLNLADTAMWERIAQCESSGDWAMNEGNGYYGGLQFDDQTWKSVGGTRFAPRADLATKEQQIDRANALRAERGLQPWGCAHAA